MIEKGKQENRYGCNEKSIATDDAAAADKDQIQLYQSTSTSTTGQNFVNFWRVKASQSDDTI